MLLSLHIENVAVIKSIDVDFSSGFTAITGETGAGKSIIIDSINLILGAKADRDLIRHGESSLMVSALFGNFSKRAADTFADRGIKADEEGMLLIQRSVSADGRSQVKINGRSVTLAILKDISSDLLSIHGQNDTGSLYDPAQHLRLVDTYAGNAVLLENYSIEFANFESITRKIKSIRALGAERERRREMLEYQIADIDALALHPGEEEELVDKRLKIKNSEKIVKNSEFVYKALRGSDKGSVSILMDKSISALSQLSGIIPEYAEYSEKLREISYRVNDIAEEVSSILDGMESDPTESLNRIEDRLDKISKLKRKYGYTVEEILAYRASAADELETIENSEDILSSLLKEESIVYERALALANELHHRRISAVRELEAKVKDTLAYLDMPGVTFFADVKCETDGARKLLDGNGIDKIEFFLSANTGAEAQPLSRVASGGELARIMLALKEAITGKGNAETIIFDEIDSGVSGKTARKIGYKMRSLSAIGQVMCVTHSAQIASLADEHLLISKDGSTGVTETSVKSLDRAGRVRELSRILGGINVTDAQRSAAEDLLNDIDQ